MATKGKKPDEGGGFVGRLAERGEEAVTRLVDELGRNPRVTDALNKAMSAKGKVDEGARRTLSQVGLAAADELKDLRKQIERLERRLARLEGSRSTRARPASSATAKRSETKKKPTTRKRTTTTVKKDAEKATSPDPGRSIGGGSGRGSSPGGGSAAA
jgi:polyhydroxyalkanoate synthesis regulator phasin